MSGPIELWQQVADAFDQRYRAIADAQWAASTPCEEWTVRDLVDHAVGVQVRYGAPLGAAAPDGADWAAARAALVAALAAPGALDGTVDHPALGEVPKAALVGIATYDLLIHTWDLARAIGADEALPAEPVAAAEQALRALPADVVRSPGRYATEVEVPADADPQARMLAFAGRRP
jgi:uncharacterized protein (TIGR03086 family)